MEFSQRVNDNLNMDGKDFSLLTEDENFYLLLVLTLEFLGPPSQQLVPFKFLMKYFKYDEDLIATTVIIQNLKKVYDAFKITNYNLYIHYFDEYFTNLRTDISLEEDPLKKKKLSEIWNDLCSLDPYLRISADVKDRIFLDRENFDYDIGFKAFNYFKDEIKVFFDIYPSDFSDKEQLNTRIKNLFDNITDISKNFNADSLIFEMEKSKNILLDFSGDKASFKIPFKKVGSIKGINLIRLMKYWEVEGYIEVDDWLGDENGWNIRIPERKKEVYLRVGPHRENENLKKQLEKTKELFIETYTELAVNKEIQGKIKYFLSTIDKFKLLVKEGVLETSKEQELLREIRGFQYEVIEDDEIFLLKIKKLKADPQTIWSTRSSRGFSNALSPYILEWENIFREYLGRGEGREVSREVDTGKIENIKPGNTTNEVIFDSSTGRVWQNGVKICELTIDKAPYKFFKYLYENKGKVLKYDELKNEVNSGQMNTTSAKYCQKLKNGLDERIKRYIKPNGIGFIFDLE